MSKVCIACGMPMEKTDDFAMGDQNKDYCHYCAREDGSMKSYDETLEYAIVWAMEGENYKMMGLKHARQRMKRARQLLNTWRLCLLGKTNN